MFAFRFPSNRVLLNGSLLIDKNYGGRVRLQMFGEAMDECKGGV